MAYESITMIIGDVILLYLFIAILFVIFIAIIGALNRKRTEYRKTMSDLFVVARIKQIAEKCDIDLAKEFKDFNKWRKEGRIHEQPIDVTVEKELQEEITRLNQEGFSSLDSNGGKS